MFMNENVIRILKTVFEVVSMEEEGSAEHITEYLSSKEIYDELVAANVDVSDIEEYKNF